MKVKITIVTEVRKTRLGHAPAGTRGSVHKSSKRYKRRDGKSTKES